MTFHQKALVYLLGIIGALLFQWPAGPLMLFFIADMNGDIPLRTHDATR